MLKDAVSNAVAISKAPSSRMSAPVSTNVVKFSRFGGI